MQFLVFLHLFSLPFFASCSLLTNKQVELAHFKKDQLEKLNREALVVASKRLEQMVGVAKTHKESRDYLASDLFLKANMSLIEGDYTTAAALFKHVADLEPDNDFIQKKYAISLIRSGDLEKSQFVLENLYKKTEDEKVGMILAGVYSGTDQETKSNQLYVHMLVKDPRNEDACIFLAKSYAKNKKMNDAFSRLKMCSLKNPESGIYDYYLGKLSIDLGKNNQAFGFFKRAHQKQPDLTQITSALGIMLEEREEFSQAMKLYEKHLSRKPQDGAILGRVVQLLFSREKYDEVIPYAEKLSDIEPEDLNLKVKLGVLYTDTKKYDQAISVFKELLVAAPESDKILYYLGAIHQEMKEYQNSIEYFNQIPPSSSLYSDSSIQMANMLSTLAQEEFHSGGSKEMQQRFITLVNKKIDELSNLRLELSIIKAGFYEGTSQYRKALESVIVVQEEKGFSTHHKYYLANMFEKEKRYEESTGVIMSIIEKEPKNAHAWNFLGYALLVRGAEIEKAYEYIQTALKISPTDGYIRDSLGWYYYKKGETKKALAELEYAYSKVPDDIEIIKHLAIVYYEIKDYERAKRHFEEALKHARYPSERVDILATLEELENDRLPAAETLE